MRAPHHMWALCCLATSTYHVLVYLVFIGASAMDPQSCLSSSSGGPDQGSSCSALVVYDEKSRYPLEAFSQKFKIVEIGGREYKVRQSWTSNGVAGVLWDAAIVLSEYFAEKPEVVKRKRILELGAGTGLPTVVAVQSGALSVTSTDLPSSIPLLKRNILLNLAHEDQLDQVDVRELVWGRSNTIDLMEQMPFGTYDLVIGADVVYNEDVFNDLLETLSTAVELSSKNGVATKVILSMRLRYDRDTNFLALLAGVFSDVDEIHFDTGRDIHIYLCANLK